MIQNVKHHHQEFRWVGLAHISGNVTTTSEIKTLCFWPFYSSFLHSIRNFLFVRLDLVLSRGLTGTTRDHPRFRCRSIFRSSVCACQCQSLSMRNPAGGGGSSPTSPPSHPFNPILSIGVPSSSPSSSAGLRASQVSHSKDPSLPIQSPNARGAERPPNLLQIRGPLQKSVHKSRLGRRSILDSNIIESRVLFFRNRFISCWLMLDRSISPVIWSVISSVDSSYAGFGIPRNDGSDAAFCRCPKCAWNTYYSGLIGPENALYFPETM